MDQYQRSRPAAAGATPMLTARIQRVRRILGFSGQLAQALYDEFGLEQALATPARTAGVTAPLVPPTDRVALVEPFVQRLAGILAKVVAGESLVERAGASPEAEAFRLLTAFETSLVDLQAECRTLDADATILRERLGEAGRAPGTGSLGAPSAPAARQPSTTGPLDTPGRDRAEGLTGWFRRIVAEATVVTQPTAPPPPPPDPAFERARQAFEVAHKFLAQALTYASPRLSIVDLAMRITGLPAARKTWDQVKREMPVAMFRAKLPPDAAHWVPPITKLFHENAEATRRAHVVLTHWEGARSACDEAEVLRLAIDRAAPHQAVGMLREFDLARYKAAIHPLKHVHVSFRGLPHLSVLFPPPPDARPVPTSPLKFHA